MLNSLWNFRLSVMLTLIIGVVCLVPIPETPLQDVRFIDKYTHVLMYWGYASVLWGETVHRNRGGSFRLQNYLVCFLFPILLGGLIEVCQACLTTSRNGDFTDFLANAFGVLISLPFGWGLQRFFKTHPSSF